MSRLKDRKIESEEESEGGRRARLSAPSSATPHKETGDRISAGDTQRNGGSEKMSSERYLVVFTMFEERTVLAPSHLGIY